MVVHRRDTLQHKICNSESVLHYKQNNIQNRLAFIVAVMASLADYVPHLAAAVIAEAIFRTGIIVFCEQIKS